MPEPGTVRFPPTLEDTAALRVNNKDPCLGEGDGVAKISANSPNPMRVGGKKGMTWPCLAAEGREGTKADVALAIDLSGSPFATRTQTVGASGLRFATGALDEK